MNAHRKITSTFSIIGIDPATEELGIAVATNEICVGNSTIYIEKGIGAISVIADTDVRYGIDGMELLRKGYSAKECLAQLLQADQHTYNRQVGIISADGSKAVHNGSSIQYWKGNAGAITGDGYIVMGNSLQKGVLSAMSATFERASGQLGEKLLASLLAGQDAGGQIDGKQSAALKVLGKHVPRSHQIDLRVDYSTSPFKDLSRLANFHFGRLVIVEALNCLFENQFEKGRRLLGIAEKKIGDWIGAQEELILAYTVLQEFDYAVNLIHDALYKEPKWKSNLPAFHLLKDHPRLQALIDEGQFDEQDWIKAINNYLLTDQLDMALRLCNKAQRAFPATSSLRLIEAQAWLSKGNLASAYSSLELAVQLDPDNEEAKQFKKNLYS